ncbi:SDR family NAD(P)-dependent oxidoreductase [Spirillospora sp. NPDC047279]|uniref:SDR family NAD(P)-dependent oxidoreductase n=1 Tax=Spirillospora sp. NPDC047279 TaxID=3155478 RepID=UPI0033F15E0F
MPAAHSARRRVLVTGGSIGIGAACVRAFARAGDHVIIADILDAESAALASELGGEGGSVDVVHMDMRSPLEIGDGVTALQGRGFDVVVANAGIARRQTFDGLTDEAWDEVVEVNLRGAMQVFRSAMPAMAARGTGSMIAMSSVHGIAYGWEEHAHYSTSKAGLIGLTRALATELGPQGIRVNAIAPGLIRTAQSLDETNSAGAAQLEASLPMVPLGRIGEPDDVADVATFLASHAARYVTGQVIVVDGGLTVKL